MQVPFLDLKRQYRDIATEINASIQRVLDATAFAGGPFVEEFERNFAEAHGARFCVGVNSGTSALHVALWAAGVGRGDEVIVPTNTFIATAEAVSLAGAVPRFVDCDESTFNLDVRVIEQAVTPRTRAVIPVHLYGQAAPMDALQQICKKHGLLLIEDCAQAHLAQYNQKSVGTFGKAGCFSFYPGKNLGAYGEAGAVITDDETLFRKMRLLRDHGSEKKYYHDVVGHNYRMEGIQGAVLNAKLKHLANWTDQRRQHADMYRAMLEGVPEIRCPQEQIYARHVYHLFVLRTPQRDALIDFLKQKGVATGIHYPIPCHRQKAYETLGYAAGSLPVSEKLAGEIISLPMFSELTIEEIKYVCDCIKEFHKRA